MPLTVDVSDDLNLWLDGVASLKSDPRILDQDTLNYLRRYLNDVVIPEA